MKKNLIIGAVVISSVVFAYAASNTYAQSVSSHVTLVERIAERFNLNKNDVQIVFDQYKDEMHANREREVEQKLNDAVNAGKLSASQKNTLLNKFKVMQDQRSQFANLTPEERMTKMRDLKVSFDSWLKEQNIDLKSLNLGFGERGAFKGMWKFRDGDGAGE